MDHRNARTEIAVPIYDAVTRWVNSELCLLLGVCLEKPQQGGNAAALTIGVRDSASEVI